MVLIRHQSTLVMLQIHISIPYYIPVRLFVNEYDTSNFRCSRYNSMTVPAEMRHSIDLNQYLISKVFPSVFGFYYQSEGDTMFTIMLSNGHGVSAMHKTVNIMKHSLSCWINSNIRPNRMLSVQQQTVASCYKFNPLHAYNSTVRSEMSMIVNRSAMYDVIFDEQTTYTIHHGFYGVIREKSLIDMRPYEKDDDVSAYSVKKRIAKAEWAGFIDSPYTPSSSEAGRIRSLVHGVRYRIVTEVTYSMCSRIFAIVDSDVSSVELGDREWIFHYAGFTEMISEGAIQCILTL